MAISSDSRALPRGSCNSIQSTSFGSTSVEIITDRFGLWFSTKSLRSASTFSGKNFSCKIDAFCVSQFVGVSVESLRKGGK